SGAETSPDRKGNRHRVTFSDHFPVAVGLRADIPFSRNSAVQEAQPTLDHPGMFCVLLWRGRTQQRLLMGLAHTTRRGVSARARSRATVARCRCTSALPPLPDPAAHL